jgi:hypothetical protein
VDISDDCRNTRKRLKNYNQKHFLYFTDTYSFNSYLLYKRKLEFQYSLLRNSISEVSQNWSVTFMQALKHCRTNWVTRTSRPNLNCCRSFQANASRRCVAKR